MHNYSAATTDVASCMDVIIIIHPLLPFGIRDYKSYVECKKKTQCDVGC